MQDNEFTGLARELATASGAVLRQHFQAPDTGVEFKHDDSPVTRADRDAEALMRDMILKRFPEHGVIGEEFGTDRPDAEFVWTLDPIDGTVSFIHDCPLFGTLIGLLQAGKPVLGLIHLPMTHRLCIGDTRETTVNGIPVQVRNPARLADATLLATDVAAITRAGCGDGFATLVHGAQLFRTWGDCFGYLQVASGKADIMLDHDMQVWDIMPLIPVIRGAGGMITTWTGDEAGPGRPCLATGSTLHPQLVSVLGHCSNQA